MVPIAKSIQDMIIVLAGGLLAGLLTIATLKLFGSAWNFVAHLGTPPHALVALLILLSGMVLYYAAYLLLVIQGFRTHWGWGLINLICPLAAILFLFKHPKQAKVGMLLYAVALILFVLVVFLAYWTQSR